MDVTTVPNKLTGFKIALLSEHPSEHGSCANVETVPEPQVATTLIEYAGELAFVDVELVGHVAWRQSHFVEVSDVPPGENVPPRRRV